MSLPDIVSGNFGRWHKLCDGDGTKNCALVMGYSAFIPDPNGRPVCPGCRREPWEVHALEYGGDTGRA